MTKMHAHPTNSLSKCPIYLFISVSNSLILTDSSPLGSLIDLPGFFSTRNYDREAAGKAIGADLVNNPELVSKDPTASYQAAIWYWMTPQGDKPSDHDIATRN